MSTIWHWLAAAAAPLVTAWPVAPSGATSPATASGAPAPAAVAPVTPAAPVAPAVLAAAFASTCDGEQVNEVVRLVSVWAAQYKEAERAAYSDRGCDRPDVFCLDRAGDAGHDALPDRVRAGQPFSLEVILPVLDGGRVAVTTSGAAKVGMAAGPFADPGAAPATAGSSASPSCSLSPAQRDALKAAAQPVTQLAARPGLEALGIPAGSSDDGYWMTASNQNIFADWSRWAAAQNGRAVRFTAVEAKVEVPFAQPVLDVEFERTENGATAPSVDTHYSVWIDSGQYHLEASVLVPFVFRGRRVATLTPTAGGGAYQIGIDEDWHVTGAVMIDLFPAGRQKGQVSSFQHCRTSSCIENWLGIQVGAGLSQIFQEWYVGLMFEPVSGIAIGAGAAFLKGDFLGPGLAEGLVLASPGPFHVNSDYMVRPYFGVAITTDIFQTLDRSSVFARIW